MLYSGYHNQLTETVLMENDERNIRIWRCQTLESRGPRKEDEHTSHFFLVLLHMDMYHSKGFFGPFEIATLPFHRNCETLSSRELSDN